MSWKQVICNEHVSFAEKRRVQHYEHEQARKNSRFHSTFTFEQVEHLAQLAYEGVVPDGTYSDDECSLWEALRREFQHYK